MADEYALAARVAESLRVDDPAKRAALENALIITLGKDRALATVLQDSCASPVASKLPQAAQQALNRERTRLNKLRRDYLELVTRFRALSASLESTPGKLNWACPLVEFARLTELESGHPLHVSMSDSHLPTEAVYRHEQVSLRYLRLPLLTEADLARAVLRFRREALPSVHLYHCNLLRTIALAQEGALLALVHPRVLCSLGALMRDVALLAEGGEAPLPVLWRITFLADAARGLAHLHEKGFVHGGLSLETSWLSAQSPCVVLGDWGLDSLRLPQQPSGSTEGGGALSPLSSAGGSGGDASPVILTSGASAEGATPRALSLLHALHSPQEPPSGGGGGGRIHTHTPQASPREPASAAAISQERDVLDLCAMGMAVFEGSGCAFPPVSALPETSARAYLDALTALLQAQRDKEGEGALVLPPVLSALYPSAPRVPLAPVAEEGEASSHLNPVPVLADWSPENAVGMRECSICAEGGVLGLSVSSLDLATGEPLSACACGPVCFPCLLKDIREQLTGGGLAKPPPLPQCFSRHEGKGTLLPSIVWETAMWSKQGGRVKGLDRPLSDAQLGMYARALAEWEAKRAPAAPPSAAGGGGGGGGAGTEDLKAVGVRHCPGCKAPALHYRGHHCHHIEPGKAPSRGGCSQCGTHWCYVCQEDLGKRGPGEGADSWCPNHCPLFCWPSVAGELPPLECSAACPCVDCPECKVGKPCMDCQGDGRCWVCAPENRLTPGQLARQSVLQMRNHTGHWREVVTKRAFAAPGVKPFPIVTYCDRNNTGGGGHWGVPAWGPNKKEPLELLRGAG